MAKRQPKKKEGKEPNLVWLEMLRVMVLAATYKHSTRWLTLDLIQSAVLFSGVSGVPRQEVETALHFLVSSGFVSTRFSPMGAIKQFQITAAGMLMLEREYPTYACSSE